MPVATVTVSEAARALHIAPGTAYKQISAGNFPLPVRRVGGRVVILQADLDRWAIRSTPLAPWAARA